VVPGEEEWALLAARGPLGRLHDFPAKQ